jgi:hypothetical protein
MYERDANDGLTAPCFPVFDIATPHEDAILVQQIDEFGISERRSTYE